MEVLIGIGLSLLAQLSKKLIVRFGDWAMHAAIFAVALVGVVAWQVIQGSPELEAMLWQAVEVLTIAVGVYEVVLKRLGAKDTDTIRIETEKAD